MFDPENNAASCREPLHSPWGLTDEGRQAAPLLTVPEAEWQEQQTRAARDLQQASASGVEVGVVVGLGVARPEQMWSLVVAGRRLDQWAWFGLDLLGSGSVVQVLGETGPVIPSRVAGRSDCPVVTELFGGMV